MRELLEKYREIWAISSLSSLASWDMETYMPEKGIEDRAEALSRVSLLRKRLITHPDFIRLVERVEQEARTDFERGVVRVLRREIHYYTSIPEELLREEERTTAEARVVWRKAKKKADFSLFEPYLRRVVEIEREKAERLGYEEHPYDALLDLFEEGLRTKDVRRMFSVLKELRNLVVDMGKHPLEEERYEKTSMEALNREVLIALGFPFKRGRVDVSPHPFTERIGQDDVRITTWYHGKDFKRSLLATIHEFGHALYELQIDPELRWTPVGEGVSMGIHESQSRFWENVVARSRPFVEHFFDTFVRHLPFLRSYTPEDVYTYFNVVRPSPIRVEADEVTYNLHILVRFEIEYALIDGSLDVSEVPARWNELMQRYLGIYPENDAVGCLQDPHWAMGAFGYFPTYTIGTVLAAQVGAREDVQKFVQECDFPSLHTFLRERIHRFGAIYPPKELVERALGESINPKYFLKRAREIVRALK